MRPSDNETLVVATVLRQSVSSAEDAKASERLVRYAARVARESLDRQMIAAGCLHDRGPARSGTDLLRLVAERAEQGGKLDMAESILESMASLTESVEESGRVLADRARNSYKRGFIDLAEGQYRELLRRGRRHRSPEMKARAYSGLGALAQMRGNFPEMKRMAVKAVRLASTLGLDRLAATGEAGLGVHAARMNDYSAAVEHFWRGYQLADGDERLEPELLTDLAEVFRLANRPVEARAAARAVLGASPVVRIALPALGVFALANASLGDRVAVDWSARQTVKLARVRGHARDIAGALFECAAAYELVGRSTQSGVLERRAQAIALKHGFHDLTFGDALTAARAPRPVALARRAEEAATEVVKLDSVALPSDLDIPLAMRS